MENKRLFQDKVGNQYKIAYMIWLHSDNEKLSTWAHDYMIALDTILQLSLESGIKGENISALEKVYDFNTRVFIDLTDNI